MLFRSPVFLISLTIVLFTQFLLLLVDSGKGALCTCVNIYDALMSIVHISLSGDRLICGEASFVTEYYLSECSDERVLRQRELRLKSNLYLPRFREYFLSVL